MRFKIVGIGNIEIPYNASEVSFRDNTKFRDAEQVYFDRTPKEDRNNKDQVIDCLLPIFGDVIKQDKIPLHKDGDDLKLMVDNGYFLNIGDELSLSRLYAHYVTVINSYKPIDFIPEKGKKITEYSFKYKNRTFHIGADRLEQFLGFQNGESIEVHHLRASFAKMAKANKDNKGNQGSNIDFSLGVQQVAILARKKGEKLPFNSVERREFILKRAKFFEELPMDVVLNIRGFFLHIMKPYAKEAYTNYFLKVKSLLNLETRKSRNQDEKRKDVASKKVKGTGS